MSQQKQEWGSRLGVILAVAGSAVGLGNFLRFPGQVAQNGGGAFMIPYFCALLFLGIPIGWAEWAMARYGGRKGFHSAPGILGVVGKGSLPRYLGVIGVLIPLAVYFYYVLIESWCLGYCYEYFVGIFKDGPAFGATAADAKTHFDAFTGAAKDGALFDFSGADSGLHETSLGFWVLTFAVNFILLYRGLSKGIESFCKWAMPVMALAGLVVLFKVLSLGTPDPTKPDQSVSAGLGFMWNPQFDKILQFDAWLAAAGQIFFSLSVGFGVVINYASYLKKKDDVVLSGLTASATNEFFEVGLGGLITIPAAFVFLGAIGTAEAVKTGSFGLGFKTLPVVFASMGAVGDVIGCIWFFMLFLAAITSSLSMLQPALAFLEEALGVDRKKGTLGLLALGCLGNLFVLYYSKDLAALDTIDFWVGTLLIFVLAAVQIICFGWIFGIDRGIREAELGAQMKIPAIYRGIIKYVAPAYLIIVFVGFCFQNLPGYVDAIGKSPTAQKSIAFIAIVAAFLVWAVGRGAARWRAQGLDLDGQRPPDDETPLGPRSTR
jgi:SNF family Na+-dependent transporter